MPVGSEAATGGVLKKIRKNWQENTCAKVYFLMKLQAKAFLSKKKTLTQVLSCEFYKIFKKTYFTEHHQAIDFIGCGSRSKNSKDRYVKKH